MKYGLKENTLQDIHQVFATFPQIQKVILYGSRAKGNYKPGSDIDITMVGQDITISMLNKISLALDDLYLPQTFDISILEKIDNPDLIEHIERVGLEFYQKK